MIVKISKETWEDAMLEIGKIRNRKEGSIVLKVILEDESGQHSSFMGVLYFPDELIGKVYNPEKEYQLGFGDLLRMTRFRENMVDLDINTPDERQCRERGYSLKLVNAPFQKITSIKVYSIHELIDEIAKTHNKSNPEKIIV